MFCSAFSGFSEFLFFVLTSLAFEKRRSLVTEIAGTANNSRATFAMHGNRRLFFSYHFSGQLSLSITASSKYSRISRFPATD